MSDVHSIALKRNKFQKWLLIASAIFLVIALISFVFLRGQSSSNNSAPDLSTTPLSEILNKANTNYEKGEFKEAIPYLNEAASRGNAKALYSLGYMYENGEGVDKDIDKAKEYYQLSAEKGHKKAKLALKNLGK